MKFLENHEFVISTLSPVHIGCGEDYEPTNYVVSDKGALHSFDPFAMAVAGGKVLMEDIDKALQEDDPAAQLRAVHAALQKYRDRLPPAANAEVPMCAGVLAHYRQTQNAPHDFNKNGIERTAFNLADQLPYLPGSSLKGAVRTAWLWKQGAGASPITPQLKQRISEFNRMIEEAILPNGKSTWQLKKNCTKRNYEDTRKGIEKDLNKAADRLGPEWLGGKFETDPMRALKIGDAHAAFPDIEREIRFCLNRSRSGRVSQAQSKNLYTRLEYIAEHQPAAFRLELALQAFESFAGLSNTNDKNLIPAHDKLLRWPALIKACNDYYRQRLDTDLATVRMLKPDSTWAAQTHELLNNGLGKGIQSGECLLLRVGKHGGADSNTVDGRQIKIMLNESRRTVDGREERIRLWVFDDEPRTTWFCGDDLEQPHDILPHGWIVIGTADAPWLSCMAGHARRTERLRHTELLNRQREEAEAAKRRASVEKAAREAALAAMTLNQRRVEEFREFCERRAEQLMGNKEATNAQIHTKARELAKAAREGADWTAEEKRTVADALDEWLPKLVSKIDMKEERKKLGLTALRGQKQ